MTKTSIHNFFEKLKSRLQQPLPGKEAQFKMAPLTRLDLLNEPVSETPIHSSVLILLYPKEGELYTVFIKRPEYIGAHSGQVSFPGGKSESFDKSLEETALREANEEVGIIAKNIIILGELTPLYIQRSNFMVYPFIGYLNETPQFICDLKEVDYVIEAKLANLMDPKTIKEKELILNNLKLDVPYYDINKEIVWGATAMILSEFLELLND